MLYSRSLLVIHLKYSNVYMMGFPGGLMVKNPPAIQKTQEMRVQSLGHEDLLDEGMATHSGIFA